jgi:protein-S-isoprenylcysteine O-methyltransferase Ste14
MARDSLSLEIGETSIMIGRILAFVYGAVSYALFLVTIIYAIGFVGNFGVPKSVDSVADSQWQNALLIDIGLLLIFAFQHSLMARPGFKRLLTRIVPATIERSTFVLASSAALLFLFWRWQPLGGTVWNVQSVWGKATLYGGFAFGWGLVFLATFVINHFDLFGLRQVWRHLLGKSQASVQFKTPLLYGIVRHPLYLGFLFAFWSTPVMTVTHLVFALVTTAYIVTAIQLEERDLMQVHPEYAEYRKRVPMLVPGLPKVDGVESSRRLA